MERETEVAIVGAGIVGLATARELSKYKTDVTLIEKEPSVCMGITKGSICDYCSYHPVFSIGGLGMMEFFNEMIFDNPERTWYIPGYERKYMKDEILAGELMAKSQGEFTKLCEELDVPFVNSGNILVAKNKIDMRLAEITIKHAEKYGIRTNKLVDKKVILDMEPNINPSMVVGGVWAPESGKVDLRLCFALAENIRANGVEILLGHKVTGIDRENGSFLVHTDKGKIRSKFIVNAAGLYAVNVAKMVHADDFSTFPIRGQVCILDKRTKDLVKHQIYSPGIRMFHIIGIGPTTEGNLMAGAMYGPTKKGNDKSTTRAFTEMVFLGLNLLFPMISKGDVIRTYSSSAVFENPDTGELGFRIRTAPLVPRFVNVVIPFPGVHTCPAVAEKVVEVLAEEGLELTENPGFNPRRKAIQDFSEISDEERDSLIEKDPAYSRVVCRCETVTEGEIVEAIRRGARTMDDIKYMVRPGMGRCQGGFCGPRVLEILSRELNKPKEEIIMKGEGSEVLHYKSKELLK